MKKINLFLGAAALVSGLMLASCAQPEAPKVENKFNVPANNTLAGEIVVETKKSNVASKLTFDTTVGTNVYTVGAKVSEATIVGDSSAKFSKITSWQNDDTVTKFIKFDTERSKLFVRDGAYGNGAEKTLYYMVQCPDEAKPDTYIVYFSRTEGGNAIASLASDSLESSITTNKFEYYDKGATNKVSAFPSTDLLNVWAANKTASENASTLATNISNFITAINTVTTGGVDYTGKLNDKNVTVAANGSKFVINMEKGSFGTAEAVKNIVITDADLTIAAVSNQMTTDHWYYTLNNNVLTASLTDVGFTALENTAEGIVKQGNMKENDSIAISYTKSDVATETTPKSLTVTIKVAALPNPVSFTVTRTAMTAKEMTAAFVKNDTWTVSYATPGKGKIGGTLSIETVAGKKYPWIEAADQADKYQFKLVPNSSDVTTAGETSVAQNSVSATANTKDLLKADVEFVDSGKGKVTIKFPAINASGTGDTPVTALDAAAHEVTYTVADGFKFKNTNTDDIIIK